ncbi:sulfite exporter TauE/SafE family protein [Geosporobacter ferrireducens]|uniref:Probable membrane transporter protein n=1 Tax=Geosporobacter ferrireducens TaxID=1424294 RepID=A0A1D8GCI0_9FIRM|nr:sulfite exporter TauE/SafE family protein [Geosporobacter ferrireducens]AOT68602.1 permease [Geosporobacter ferrireducens]MTI54071.1 sulfite exporter TauE/SafE family protein [Geosporobacter ferrireducens]
MLLILIGLFSGIIGAMGIGGGTILIPALIIFTALTQHQAQSVNLISFLPVAVVALFTHFKNKNIEIQLCLPLIFLGMVGAIGGSFLAVNLPSELLRRLFGIFLFFMGLYEFFWKEKSRTK